MIVLLEVMNNKKNTKCPTFRGHINGDMDNPCRELVPAINNLIFMHSTQERISHLKLSNETLEPLRYLIDQTAQQPHTIMTVSDGQMENFMRVASRTDDSVMFLDDESIVGKEGKRVEIAYVPAG